MGETGHKGAAAPKRSTPNRTTAERISEREMVVTRSFDAPARLVFQAWTRPELMQRWWVPKSAGITLLSCEQDVRVGGRYRLEFAHPSVPSLAPEAAGGSMAFFGTYLEVDPPRRLVWTNEESADGAVTTLTLEEVNGRTLLRLHELYPSKEAVDEALAGMAEAMPEMFEQLDELLISLRKDDGAI